MKIKVTLSFCLMLMTVVVFGQDQECFSGMTKKLMDWVRQDFESPQEAQKAKVGIVEGLIGCDMPKKRTLSDKSGQKRTEFASK
jgi:ribosome biogenesis SPOUT family RNA methylase Rps3